jgi:hypothetical protein
LIDFVYQAAKAVVEALNPSRSTTGRSAVAAALDLELIRERMRSEPGALVRLYRVLAAYFFDGYPRASSFETVLDEQSPPLSLLVSMAERWILGHEYGHGLASLSFEAPPEVNLSRAREYSADAAATIATVRSAAELDHVSPEFALGGAIFALSCLDILVRASNLLRTGKEENPSGESETHPPTRDRAMKVIATFRQFFDVRYDADGGFDLDFVLRREAPEAHNFSREHGRRAFAFANVLQTLWPPVARRLLDEHRAGRELHSHWV